MQYNAIPCNTMQYHAIPCNTMQYHAIPCITMQYYAIQCNTMHYPAKPCNTMHYHASLITADGAYHCPVGSIWPFFINSFCNINSHAVERCTEFDKRNALCAGMLLNGLGCFLLNFWFLMPCQFSLFEYTGNQSQRNHLVMDHGSPGKTASARKKHFFAYLCLDTGTGSQRR